MPTGFFCPIVLAMEGVFGYFFDIPIGRMSMTSEIIFIVEESVDGGFEAKALDHSIYTEADTLEGIKSTVRDAVQCHFDEEDRPKLIRLHMVKDEVIAA
jgi:hypothetical protein